MSTKKITASAYQNAKKEKGVQVSMPRTDADAIAKGDKTKAKAVIDAIKAAVK